MKTEYCQGLTSWQQCPDKFSRGFHYTKQNEGMQESPDNEAQPYRGSERRNKHWLTPISKTCLFKYIENFQHQKLKAFR